MGEKLSNSASSPSAIHLPRTGGWEVGLKHEKVRGQTRYTQSVRTYSDSSQFLPANVGSAPSIMPRPQIPHSSQVIILNNHRANEASLNKSRKPKGISVPLLCWQYSLNAQVSYSSSCSCNDLPLPRILQLSTRIVTEGNVKYKTLVLPVHLKI